MVKLTKPRQGSTNVWQWHGPKNGIKHGGVMEPGKAPDLRLGRSDGHHSPK